MRTRTKSDVELLPCFTESTSCAGVTATTNWTDLRLRNGTTKTTVDVVTPNFKKRSAQGAVINSPYSSITTTYASSAGVGGYDYIKSPCVSPKVYRQTAFGLSALQAPSPVSLILKGDPLVSSLRSEAVATARSSIEEPVLQTLVELADARKILTGLASSAWKFGNILNSIRKSGDFSKWLSKRFKRGVPSDPRILANELTNFIGANWLKYRYMILPIFLSARAVLEDLEQKPPTPERQTFRGFASDSSSDEVDSHSESLHWNYDITYSTVRSIECRAGFLTELVRDLAVVEKYGLTLGDVPSAAWELLPFSFIADWFVNVGDVIAAHRPLVGRRTLASWVTTTETVVYGFELQTTGKPSDSYSKLPCTTVGTVVYTVKVRQPSPSISLTLRYADVNLTTFWNRLADATALAKLILMRG